MVSPSDSVDEGANEGGRGVKRKGICATNEVGDRTGSQRLAAVNASVTR